MEKLKLFEMFAGYGGASFSLKKAKIPFECVGYSEIDKYAIQCYEQNHKGNNFGDCSNINPKELPDFDLLTGGFPCQSFSIAGKGKGELGPRGTLFWDIIRIAEVKKPKYILLENVKGLTNKKFKPTFQKMLGELKRIGYDVRWKVLNTKNYGIPQNRERVFFVCKLGGWNNNCPKIDYSKGKPIPEFQFPKEEELKLCIRDLLEDEVDEKYFLKEYQIKRLLKRDSKGFDGKITKFINNKNRDVCSNNAFTLSRSGRNCGSNQIIQLNNPDHSNNRIYSEDGCSPTLNTMCGGNRQPFILKVVGNVNPSGKGMNGNVYSGDISPTITTNKGEGIKILIDKNDNYYLSGKIYSNGDCGNANRIFKPEGVSQTIQAKTRTKIIQLGMIRKLTPTECFRLMGFLNDKINLEGISNSQRYKLAGNGWDVNLVSKIFKKMFR